jgi:hypothetical protein
MAIGRSTQYACGRRALDALIGAQGINDLYRIQVIAQQEHESFNIASIGPEFNYHHEHPFAPDYLRYLFAYSYERAKSGDPWRNSLPEPQLIVH